MAFVIGVEYPKHKVNVGTLIRSTVGRPYKFQSSDTTKSYRRVPILHFVSWEDYRASAVFAWVPVAIEIADEAVPLSGFHHPKEAVYFLGPENGSLSTEAIAMAKHVVRIPSILPYCLNVAVAGSVVMYDRLVKNGGGVR